MVAEEATTLEIPDMAALFADIALYWTRFVDLEPYIARLEQMLSDLQVAAIAPARRLPITDVEATFPYVREGLLLGGARSEPADTLASALSRTGFHGDSVCRFSLLSVSLVCIP